jgi:hypothetical protein
MAQSRNQPICVIAGLDPAIQGNKPQCLEPLDARVKDGHDD